MSTIDDTLSNAHAILAGAQAKIDQLRNINPFFIDLSLRENPVGARVGQTLQDKLAILPKVREFGFDSILLGTLDYSMPDELEVDDDFMMYLRDHQIDMTGCYAFTDIGLVNDAGEPFTLEYMIDDQGFERVYSKFIQNMKAVGVDASFRLVDGAQYQERKNRFDFDLIGGAFSLGSTPTRDTLVGLFGSLTKDREGSNNFVGMADPAVDALIDVVNRAKNRESLTMAMRALDRVLRARFDWIPNIHSESHRAAYWDMFGFREPKPDYGWPVERLWWLDEEKARALGKA